MAIDEATRLRDRLGEPIPSDGSAADTLFSDEAIEDLLTRHGSVDAAVGEGWEIKAAKLAGMVDVTEGDSRRNLSALHRQAVTMVRRYDSSSPAGRTRIGKISRPFG